MALSVAAALVSGWANGPAQAQGMGNQSPKLGLWKEAGETPLPNCDPRTFIIENLDPLEETEPVAALSVLDLTTSSTAVDLDWVSEGFTGYIINALAYNPADNFLYGMKESLKTGTESTALLRIGADAKPRFVGTIANFDGQGEAIAAEFGEDGRYYILSKSGTMQAYDITANGPEARWSEPQALGAPGLLDFGVKDGFFLGREY